MATTTITVYRDDLTGDELTPEEVRITRFAVDGTEYELDLSADSHEAFTRDLDRYVASARRVGGKRPARRTTVDSDTQTIRKWAASQGIEVSERGRIPASVREAFKAAQAVPGDGKTKAGK